MFLCGIIIYMDWRYVRQHQQKLTRYKEWKWKYLVHEPKQP